MRNILILICLSICGCVLMPQITEQNDPFDGTAVIKFDPVSASGMFEGWHSIGLLWSQKHPDVIYVTISVPGTRSITGIEFNVGGQIFSATPGQPLTAFDGGPAFRTSVKTFKISRAQFLTIAASGVVKLKVSGINDYTLSTFGPDAGDRPINKYIMDFMRKLPG